MQDPETESTPAATGRAPRRTLHLPRQTQILRLPDVLAMTGLSRTAVYTLVGSNDFPAAIKLGAKSIGWYLSDIERWLASRPLASIGAAGKEAPTQSAPSA